MSESGTPLRRRSTFNPQRIRGPQETPNAGSARTHSGRIRARRGNSFPPMKTLSSANIRSHDLELPDRPLMGFEDYRQLLLTKDLLDPAAPTAEALVGRSKLLGVQRYREIQSWSLRIARIRKSRQKLLREEIQKAIGVLVAPSHEPIIKRFNVEITAGILSCLRPLEWLNDEVINFYVNLLMERNQRHLKAGHEYECRVPRTYIWTTFFYSKLIDEDNTGLYNYTNVARWTTRRKIDIFQYDLVLVPINVKKVHWALGVIDLRRQVIEYLDSMNAQGRTVAQNLLRWLSDEYHDKKGAAMPNLAGWAYIDETTKQSVPQQTNGSDCGVFTCQFCECLADGRSLDFSQADIDNLRLKMFSIFACPNRLLQYLNVIMHVGRSGTGKRFLNINVAFRKSDYQQTTVFSKNIRAIASIPKITTEVRQTKIDVRAHNAFESAMGERRNSRAGLEKACPARLVAQLRVPSAKRHSETLDHLVEQRRSIPSRDFFMVLRFAYTEKNHAAFNELFEEFIRRQVPTATLSQMTSALLLAARLWNIADRPNSLELRKRRQMIDLMTAAAAAFERSRRNATLRDAAVLVAVGTSLRFHWTDERWHFLILQCCARYLGETRDLRSVTILLSGLLDGLSIIAKSSKDAGSNDRHYNLWADLLPAAFQAADRCLAASRGTVDSIDLARLFRALASSPKLIRTFPGTAPVPALITRLLGENSLPGEICKDIILGILKLEYYRPQLVSCGGIIEADRICGPVELSTALLQECTRHVPTLSLSCCETIWGSLKKVSTAPSGNEQEQFSRGCSGLAILSIEAALIGRIIKLLQQSSTVVLLELDREGTKPYLYRLLDLLINTHPVMQCHQDLYKIIFERCRIQHLYHSKHSVNEEFYSNGSSILEVVTGLLRTAVMVRVRPSAELLTEILPKSIPQQKVHCRENLLNLSNALIDLGAHEQVIRLEYLPIIRDLMGNSETMSEEQQRNQNAFCLRVLGMVAKLILRDDSLRPHVPEELLESGKTAYEEIRQRGFAGREGIKKSEFEDISFMAILCGLIVSNGMLTRKILPTRPAFSATDVYMYDRKKNGDIVATGHDDAIEMVQARLSLFGLRNTVKTKLAHSPTAAESWRKQCIAFLKMNLRASHLISNSECSLDTEPEPGTGTQIIFENALVSATEEDDYFGATESPELQELLQKLTPQNTKEQAKLEKVYPLLVNEFDNYFATLENDHMCERKIRVKLHRARPRDTLPEMPFLDAILLRRLVEVMELRKERLAIISDIAFVYGSTNRLSSRCSQTGNFESIEDDYRFIVSTFVH